MLVSRFYLQHKAIAMVGGAVERGELPAAKTQKCVDCGKDATEYDHRDYLKPLDVEPTCRACNLARGQAAPIKSPVWVPWLKTGSKVERKLVSFSFDMPTFESLDMLATMDGKSRSAKVRELIRAEAKRKKLWPGQ